MYVPMYLYTERGGLMGAKKKTMPAPQRESIVVERIQTGVRLEKRLLKVLKGLAEYHDLSLGDLLEGIVLHVFEGKLPLKQESLKKIVELKKVYHLDLDAKASHKLKERKNKR